MDINLKDYLTTFFVWNKESKNRVRLYKWQRIKEDLELINSLNPIMVLDLGCGDNRYQSSVNNLIGIDIVYSPNVDIVGDFTNLDEKFEDNSVDAIIAYGSINFGNEELIEKQLLETKRVLKKDGIICFRACSTSDSAFYYNWTKEKCYQFTEKLNFSFVQEPSTIYRLKRTGEINTNWGDIRSQRFDNNSSIRENTRLHWIWKNE